ncbi:MAG: hypothetical protein JWO88_2479 [Frankiales bacterium]|nr:hypothetical protein [Frankiales bacterium]
MSWYGDPDSLDRLAAHLSSSASDVRDRARAVRGTVASARWQGPAADAFHGSVLHQTRQVDRAADELEDAAAALHRHAETVRAEIARLLAMERAAMHVLSTGPSTLEGLLP